MSENQLIKWIYKEFVIGYKNYFIVYIFLKAVSSIVTLVPAIFMGKIIDDALSGNYKKVLNTLLILAGLIIVNTGISIIESRLNIKINILVTNEVRKRLINKFIRMKLTDIEEIKKGEFVSRLEDAEGVVQFFVEVASLLFIDLITFLFALVVMVTISPLMTLVCIINIPVSMFVQEVFGNKIGAKEKNVKERYDIYISFLYEIIHAIKELKIFNMQHKYQNKYEDKLQRLSQIVKDKSDTSIMAGASSEILSGIFQLVLIAFGCYSIINKIMSVGQYFTYNSYMSKFGSELQIISQFNLKKQMYCVSFGRLYQIMTLEDEVDKVGAVKQVTGSSIKIRNLKFGYDDSKEEILDINELNMDANSITAIVGSNGAGKSTLMDLIVRLYDFEGTIVIGDADITDIETSTLRDKICYIQQQPYFFNTTIAENLKLSNEDRSIDEIIDACKQVGIHNVIEDLPDKYKTIIKEDGVNFSGGQLKRIALARALLTKASIIMLDEIASGIDDEGKKIFYKIISKLKESHTIIIVSHDSDIVEVADRVIELINGQ